MRLIKKVFSQIKEDIQTIYEKDPAAENILEVLLCYPGLHALILHRIAHKLNYWKIPLIPRMISNISRFFTGIEIHPQARIGRRFFIDHGMGVVIGAGSVVVDSVPENSTVVGVPGRIVRQKLLIQGQLMHNRIPDPITCQLNRLKYEVQDLKEQIEELKKGR